MRTRKIVRLVGAFVVALASAASVRAQGSRGAIAGTIVDSAGTPLGNVTVIVRSVDSGDERQSVSNPEGAFVVGGLVPGAYQVRITDPGFSPFTSADLTVVAGQRSTLSITLQRVGEAPPATPATPPPPTEPPAPAAPPTPAPTPEPATRPTAPQTEAEAVAARTMDFIPTPDRWRLEFPTWQRYPRGTPGEYPYVPGRGLDPYDQNVLKGDLPVIGQDIFMVLTGVAEAPFEYRRLPTPSGVSAERPGSEDFFGKGEQYATLPTAILSFELFKGDTAFKPRTWALRVTPVFNLNYVHLKEQNGVDATPEEGNDRQREDFALQEAFGELKLADVGRYYDFISVRAGIQPFTSDFRGFLYRDTNLGVRFFGNWGRNRNQWNVAYFDQLEKETNSELNLFERRDQRVIIANYFRQDFLVQGYTISPSFHANLDNGEEPFFDENGFLVRPAPIGLIRPHRIRAYYAGFGGDGHVGRLNLSHQFYQVLGHDEFNGIAARRIDLNAQFVAVEASFDKDWYRPRASFIWASGDRDPEDDEGRGFDAILDNPNIAGGPFSFWNRQGIRLTQTLVGLVGRSSILPSLRSSKTEGQANFVNPGVFMYNVGFDADLTPKLRATTNVSLLRFHHTETLRALLFQNQVRKPIGIDYSLGFQYRPWLNDNVQVTAGVSALTPGKGFEDLLIGRTLYTPFVVLTLTY
jgi:Carboxypeptidase regulatory-like domain